jgi:hypothetical protein
MAVVETGDNQPGQSGHAKSQILGRRARGFASMPRDANASQPLCLFLPQRLQRAAPSDDLVEHFIDRLLMPGIRLEDAEVFKVGKHG